MNVLSRLISPGLWAVFIFNIAVALANLQLGKLETAASFGLAAAAAGAAVLAWEGLQ